MKKSLWMFALLLALSPSLRAEKARAQTAGEKKLAGELAGEYNVLESEILALRDKGMGWGEVGHALAISQRAGVPLKDVLALRDSGMGWGEIAQKYNFKLGEVTGKAKDVGARGDKAAGTRAKGPKSEAASKRENMDQPQRSGDSGLRNGAGMSGGPMNHGGGSAGPGGHGGGPKK
jgi:hypothetical protein